MSDYRVLICELSDRDFDPAAPEMAGRRYGVRRAARGVLVRRAVHDGVGQAGGEGDGGERLALLHVTRQHYHKLPGGGVEAGESVAEAFAREVWEETGCRCAIGAQGAVALEYRDRFRLLQVNYIFTAEVVGAPGTPHWEPDELAEGFALEWVPVDEAARLVAGGQPADYQGQFIQRRDAAILAYYRAGLGGGG